MYRPRASQQRILEYPGGRMGISAVPGSGKTHTLSALAARLIRDGTLEDDQEILVVTLVNSAVVNFTGHIEGFLKETGIMPGFQYRVRTLHGLANDILGESPSLSGLPVDYSILDEHETGQIMHQLSTAWYRAHAQEVEAYLAPDIPAVKLQHLRKNSIPKLLGDLTAAFVRTVKDRQLADSQIEAIREEVRGQPAYHFLEMGTVLYAEYQRALQYRGAVDFDDLIVLALEALRQDSALCQRLRQRWPYILEDEAQDSSRLQQDILQLLSGGSGNWVRVGDPNQAIYSTFTTANPEYLRSFMDLPGVTGCDLPESGRSAKRIIDLANHLIRWTREDHPLGEARSALALPFIQPVPQGDAAPNPDDAHALVRILNTKLTPLKEMERVADSVGAWLKENPERTVAVLSSTNLYLENIAAELKKREIPMVELLRSTSSTRRTIRQLGHILTFLANPRHPGLMSSAFEAWCLARRGGELLEGSEGPASRLLQRCQHPEDYLFPQLHAWLDEVNLQDQPQVENLLIAFQGIARHWLGATSLQVDELILLLAGDCFSDPADLALCQKVAVLLRSAASSNPEWRLPEFAGEVRDLTAADRKFTGFSQEDAGFDPARHKGKAVLATIHKAKGLEWDRVYLTSVNSFDFPSGAQGDEFLSERWYLKGRLNLQAELLSQLEFAAAHQLNEYRVHLATETDRWDYIRERLRVLYVGITRARSELLFSWNGGNQNQYTAALALIELEDFLRQKGPTGEGGGV